MLIYKGDISSKPRMTQRDAWAKRTCVTKYYSFKDSITLQANLQSFKVGPCIELIVGVEMPKSWSKKKKEEYEGMPHQQRPDVDNYLKAVLDSLCKEDSYVHIANSRKVWSNDSFIIIRNLDGKEGRFNSRHYIENHTRESL